MIQVPDYTPPPGVVNWSPAPPPAVVTTYVNPQFTQQQIYLFFHIVDQNLSVVNPQP